MQSLHDGEAMGPLHNGACEDDWAQPFFTEVSLFLPPLSRIVCDPGASPRISPNVLPTSWDPCELLAELRAHSASVCNGMRTARRLHAADLGVDCQCRLGWTDEPDDFRHDNECPRLWTCIAALWWFAPRWVNPDAIFLTCCFASKKASWLLACVMLSYTLLTGIAIIDKWPGLSTNICTASFAS